MIKNEDLRSENQSLKDNVSMSEQILKDMDDELKSTNTRMTKLKSKSMAFWF